MDNKPTDVIIYEFEQNLLKLIKNSNLPISVVEMILKRIHNDTQILKLKQLQKYMEQNNKTRNKEPSL